MTSVGIACALLAVVVLVALLRRAPASSRTKPPASPLALIRDGCHSDAVGPGPGDVVVVPLPNDTGQALVLGPEDALAIFEQSGLTRRPTSKNRDLVQQLVRDVMTAYAANATERFQHAADSGRIVQLTDETIRRLREGADAFDKQGNVLALVRTKKGHLSPMRLQEGGARVAAASNMATLAVTAALSQQLDAICEQLEAISEMLDGMVKDKDRERLSDAVAANEILCEIADSVCRRGITEADYFQLASLKHRVTSLQIETTVKIDEIAPDDSAKMPRNKRLDVLERLYANERLEYWLAVQVQADLARTRCDLLTLVWEHHSHPATAAALNRKTADAIRSRQLHAAKLGDTLRALSDPSSHTLLDPARVISRHQLGKAQARIDALLESHGAAFAGPEKDPHTISQDALETPSDRPPARVLDAAAS